MEIIEGGGIEVNFERFLFDNFVLSGPVAYVQASLNSNSNIGGELELGWLHCSC